MASPDIYKIDLKLKKIEYLILGCDGIFDKLSNNEAATAINLTKKD